MKSQGEADKLFGSDEEVADVVRRFESCAFGPTEFKHRAHLCVALFYSLSFGEPEARERMRGSILGFLAHYGLDSGVYHETITAFWLRRVRVFVEEADGSRPLAELANELLTAYGDSRLIFEYYSKERLDSEKARAYRVEPDLKELDF